MQYDDLCAGWMYEGEQTLYDVDKGAETTDHFYTSHDGLLCQVVMLWIDAAGMPHIEQGYYPNGYCFPPLETQQSLIATFGMEFGIESYVELRERHCYGGWSLVHTTEDALAARDEQLLRAGEESFDFNGEEDQGTSWTS